MGRMRLWGVGRGGLRLCRGGFWGWNREDGGARKGGITLRARGGEIVVWGSGRGKCRLLLAWRWRVAEGKCSMERVVISCRDQVFFVLYL